MLNLSSNDQENYLIQISKKFEQQSNLIKIYPFSKNFSKCLLDTADLISLLKIDLLTPSNYYLLYIDAIDILQETIEYYIRDNVSKGTKIKYIYESVQQSQYLMPRIYLMIICGSIYLELYPLKYREIIFELLNAVKCVQSPLRGFWLRYFLFKSLKNILPIKNGEYIYNQDYFFIYRNISLLFLLNNLEEMSLCALRTKREIYIDDKKMDDKQRINMISCIEEIIEEISYMKGIDKNIFVNKILPKMYDIIEKVEDGNDYYLEQVIISSIIKYFDIELYIESEGISIIFIILRKINDNQEIDKISIFNNLINNCIGLVKKIRRNENKSLKNNIMPSINSLFPLFLEKYNELQITYKNSEEKEFNKFMDLDIFYLKFALKILKDEKEEQKFIIIKNVLNSCSKRLNIFNYGFKLESFKKICLLIEMVFKYKFTIFDFPIIETMIYYLDYNHRKSISLKLIESFENRKNERYKIDSLKKIQKIINLIIPLISESNEVNEGEDSTEYLDDDDKNKYLCKLIYLLQSNKPDITIQMLKTIKTFFCSGSVETALATIPTIIYFIIKYLKELDLFYYFNISENEKEKKEYKFNYDFYIEDEELKNIDMNYIKLLKDYLNLIKESILIIENKNQIKAFQIYLIICCQLKKMVYLNKIEGNFTNELFEQFFQKSINIIKSNKKPEIKYKLFQYLCGYMQSSMTFLEKEKIESIINLIKDDFHNFNNTKIKFNIAINILDLYFYILKDEKKVETYINQAFIISFKNLELSENIDLLIILINKLLSYMEKEQRPLFLEIINEVIKQLKNSSFLTNSYKEDYFKDIYIYYKNTIEYIEKKKKQKLDTIYDSIIL